VSFNYGSTAATADRLIARFGVGVTMSRAVPGAYDPATGAPAAPTTTTQAVKMVVLDFPQSYIDGTLIRAGDRRVLVSALGINPPQAGDTFPWNGQTLVVINSKALGPSGANVLFTLQARTP
jgi:hypothetical protein